MTAAQADLDSENFEPLEAIELTASGEYTTEDIALDLEKLRLQQMAVADAVGAELGVGDDGVVFVRVYAGDDISKVRAAFDVAGLDVLVVYSAHTREAIEKTAETLRGIQMNKGEAFGFYYDPVNDLMVISGNISEDQLRYAVGEQVSYRYDYADSAGRASRNSDNAPHYGGAKINSSSVSCTSGFAVNAGGVKRMVTAGHCGETGTVFYSPGGQYFGEIRHKASFPYYDLATMSYSTYAGRIYTGATTGTYGVSSSVGGPGINGGYCSSGSVSLEICGLSVISTNTSFCDWAGCTYPVIAYTGGAPKPGDSGAPFYGKTFETGKAHIRGVVFGYSGSLGYAESWDRVAYTFIATIVTG